MKLQKAALPLVDAEILMMKNEITGLPDRAFHHDAFMDHAVIVTAAGFAEQADQAIGFVETAGRPAVTPITPPGELLAGAILSTPM